MPRKPDPDVETRILDAARALLHRGGEAAVSMRKVAAAARTNTPAVYRRFSSKDDLIRGVLSRDQKAVFEVLKDCSSAEEASERMFEFALAHPREYQLLDSPLFSRLNQNRPNLEYLLQRSAEWIGAKPQDNLRLVLSLWALLHGSVALLSSGGLTPEYAAELRLAYTASAKSLIAETARRVK
jgi:AcrR family transcriptional regulator